VKESNESANSFKAVVVLPQKKDFLLPLHITLGALFSFQLIVILFSECQGKQVGLLR